MANDKPLVFISCGEASSSERQLGADVEKMVEDLAGAQTYRARRRGTLKSRATEIVQNLNDASAYIIIFPKREECTGRKGAKYRRTSVWIEQELAIAHYCDVCVSSRKVLVFTRRNIRTEGLRGDLKLNAIPYRRPEDVLDVLRKELPGWLDDVRLSAVSKLQLWLDVLVVASGSGKYEEWQVLPRIRNVGKNPIKEWSMELLVPAALPAHSRHHLSIDQVEEDGAAYKRIAVDHQSFWGPSKTMFPHTPSPLQPQFLDVSVPNPPSPEWQASTNLQVILRVRCGPDWEAVHEVRRTLGELNEIKRGDGEPPKKSDHTLQRA